MEEQDHFDIVDFIESTIELQEKSVQAQAEINEEIQENKLTQMDILEDENIGYVPSQYSL
jgi:hypothetical protein